MGTYKYTCMAVHISIRIWHSFTDAMSREFLLRDTKLSLRDRVIVCRVSDIEAKCVTLY